MTGKNRIMIYARKGTALTSSSSGPPMATCCRSRSREPEAHVIRYFQERMPYGLYVAGRIRRALADPVVRRLAYHCPAGSRAAAYARHHPRPQTRRPGIAAS
jgi:hypothetical protein